MHAPRKQKYIRANNSNYITKALRKEIRDRGREAERQTERQRETERDLNLKAADIFSTYKKKDKSDIENYCPISILTTLSKIYEGCIYDHMYKYFDQILSKYKCCLRQGHNTQHFLLMKVERWKEAVDKGGLGKGGNSNGSF